MAGCESTSLINRGHKINFCIWVLCLAFQSVENPVWEGSAGTYRHIRTCSAEQSLKNAGANRLVHSYHWNYGLGWVDSPAWDSANIVQCSVLQNYIKVYDSMLNFSCVFFSIHCFLDIYHHSCNTRYGRIDLTMNLKKNAPRATFLYSSVNKKTLRIFGWLFSLFPLLKLKEVTTEPK